ncbi:hypothetical protein ACTXT7_000381 [Hymenolepis weldensis]
MDGNERLKLRENLRKRGQLDRICWMNLAQYYAFRVVRRVYLREQFVHKSSGLEKGKDIFQRSCKIPPRQSNAGFFKFNCTQRRKLPSPYPTFPDKF